MNSPTDTAPSVHHFLFSAVTKRCIRSPFLVRKLARAKLAELTGRRQRVNP